MALRGSCLQLLGLLLVLFTAERMAFTAAAAAQTPMASPTAKLNSPWELSGSYPPPHSCQDHLHCPVLGTENITGGCSKPSNGSGFSTQPRPGILGISRAITANIQRHPEQQHIVPSPTSSSGSIFQTDDMREASMQTSSVTGTSGKKNQNKMEKGIVFLESAQSQGPLGRGEKPRKAQ